MQDYLEGPGFQGNSFQERVYLWSEECSDFFSGFSRPSFQPNGSIMNREIDYEILSLPGGSLGTDIPNFGNDDRYKMFKLLERGAELYREGRRLDNVGDATSGELLESGIGYLTRLMDSISFRFDFNGAGQFKPDSGDYQIVWDTSIKCGEERQKYWNIRNKPPKSEFEWEKMEKPEYSTPFTSMVDSWTEKMELFASKYFKDGSVDSEKVIQRDGYTTLKWMDHRDPREFAELMEEASSILQQSMTKPGAMDDGEFWDPLGDLYVSETLLNKFIDARAKMVNMYMKCKGIPADKCEDVGEASRLKAAFKSYSNMQSTYHFSFKAYRMVIENQMKRNAPMASTLTTFLEKDKKLRGGRGTKRDLDWIKYQYMEWRADDWKEDFSELEGKYKEGLDRRIKEWGKQTYQREIMGPSGFVQDFIELMEEAKQYRDIMNDNLEVLERGAHISEIILERDDLIDDAEERAAVKDMLQRALAA